MNVLNVNRLLTTTQTFLIRISRSRHMTIEFTARECMVLCKILETHQYPDNQEFIEEVTKIMDKLLIERETKRKSEDNG